jgi:hypothetical protein
VRGIRNTVIGFSVFKFEFSYLILHNHSSIPNLAAKAGDTVAENHCIGSIRCNFKIGNCVRFILPVICFTQINYSAFLLSLAPAQQLSRDVSADAGFLCDKVAVLGLTIKVGCRIMNLD